MNIFRLLFPLILIAAIFQRCQENNLVDNYIIDSEKSTLEWQEHSGSISQSGTSRLIANNIKAEKGRIKSGTITIPLASTTAIYPQETITDFLNQEPNNTSFVNSDIVFQIREVDLLHGIHPHAIQGANWWIRGDMTIRGQTHAVSFPAKIIFMANEMDIEAKFTIDFAIWVNKIGDTSPISSIDPYPQLDLHLKGRASINNRIII